jgi:DNA polymerase III epsilon subunit-like protein
MMRPVKVIDHSSAIQEFVNPIALRARDLRAAAYVLDTETTGVSADDEVIELAIVQAIDGSVVFDQRFRPSCKINQFAFQVHGIRDAELYGESRFADRYEAIREMITGRPIIAWNVAADSRFMAQTFRKYGLTEPPIEWVCVMKLYQAFKQLKKVPKLCDACDAMKVKAGTHSALSDAKAAARVLYRMAESAPAPEVITREIEEDEDLEGGRQTVKSFLESQGWRNENRTKGTGLTLEIYSAWIDPETGAALRMDAAIEMQRRRM